MLDIFKSEKHAERLAQSESYNIAFLSDTHIGYSAYKFTDGQGRNLRDRDGERAMYQIFKDVIDNPLPVHSVVHGGDVFHNSHPPIESIKFVQNCFNMLFEAGITLYGQAGNHDAPDNRAKLPAVAVVDDPSKGINALWTPYQQHEIHDGIFLHSVAHHGLSADEAPVITPVADGINIFSTHGAALDPKNATLMNCKDSPREQMIPSEMIIDDNFAIKLLGHYHSRYAVGGELLNTWYAGSTVRRGFSDEPGDRGWMLVKIFPDGHIDIEHKNIRQRPQYDLSVIDAKGMNATEVQDMVEAQILATGVDAESDAFDMWNAPIVRQKILNAPRSLRAGIDKRRIANLTRNMLHWEMRFEMPEQSETVATVDEHGEPVESGDTPSLVRNSSSGGSAVESFDKWADISKVLSSVPDQNRDKIKSAARKHLEAAEANRKI